MTDSGAGVGGPLSQGEIQQMVATVWPDWDLVTADWADGGTDAVYFLTVATDSARRDVVLKVCARPDRDAFRPEPYLLDAVRRETSLPVPAVYGSVDEHADLTAPFFLMERCEGETVAPGDGRLDEAALDRIAHDAGRYLGELHDVGSFARFGELRLARDVSGGGSASGSQTGQEADGRTDTRGSSSPPPGSVSGTLGGILGPGYEVTVAADAHDDWRGWFDELTEMSLAGLSERFADLEPAIRDRLEGARALLDGQFEPVPSHVDYGDGDLLVDPSTGETLAVLDFGDRYTADAEYNLAAVEHRLCGWVGLDADRRERVREHLLDGYRETNTLRDDGSLWDLYDLYLLATWLHRLDRFDDRYAGASESEREAAAETLRDVTRHLVE